MNNNTIEKANNNINNTMAMTAFAIADIEEVADGCIDLFYEFDDIGVETSPLTYWMMTRYTCASALPLIKEYLDTMDVDFCETPPLSMKMIKKVNQVFDEVSDWLHEVPEFFGFVSKEDWPLIERDFILYRNRFYSNLERYKEALEAAKDFLN